MAASGSNHAPALGKKRAHKIDSARHYRHATVIRRFSLLEVADLSLRVKSRRHDANYFDSAYAVSYRHHFLFVDSPLAGPDTPLSIDGASGIDENSIKIEENGGAAKSRHPNFLSQEGCAMDWTRAAGAELEPRLPPRRVGEVTYDARGSEPWRARPRHAQTNNS